SDAWSGKCLGRRDEHRRPEAEADDVEAVAPGNSAVELGPRDGDAVALDEVGVAVAEVPEGADLGGVGEEPADGVGLVVVLHPGGGDVGAADGAAGEVVDEAELLLEVAEALGIEREVGRPALLMSSADDRPP